MSLGGIGRATGPPHHPMLPSAMRVLWLSLGGHAEACSRTRVFALQPRLRSASVRGQVIRFASGRHPAMLGSAPLGRAERAAEVLNTLRKTLRLARLAPAFDLVVVQRVLLPPALQALVRARSRALLFDFDDAIYLSPDGTGSGRAAERFDHMVARCDAVVAASPELARRAAPLARRLYRIPTPVDTDRYAPAERPEADRAEVVVGWIGSPSTGPYLEMLRPVVERLVAERPALRFHVVGAVGALAGVPGVCHLPWRYADEVAALRRFDVGVMPLPDDPWARGKAGYKLLQYMAVGVPGVASPVGVNAELVRDGVNGFLARTPDEWTATLGRLLDNAALRRRLGAAGRELAVRHYSLGALAPAFLAALRETAGCECTRSDSGSRAVPAGAA